MDSFFEDWLGQVSDAQLETEKRHYLDQIGELNARVDAINRVMSIKKRFSRSEPIKKGLGPERIQDLLRAAERPGLADAILRLMDRDAPHAWSTDQLLADLTSEGWAPGGKTPRNSVAATLSRLYARGEVERVKAGVYERAPGKRNEDSPPPSSERGAQQLRVEDGR